MRRHGMGSEGERGSETAMGSALGMAAFSTEDGKLGAEDGMKVREGARKIVL